MRSSTDAGAQDEDMPELEPAEGKSEASSSKKIEEVA